MPGAQRCMDPMHFCKTGVFRHIVFGWILEQVYHVGGRSCCLVLSLLFLLPGRCVTVNGNLEGPMSLARIGVLDIFKVLVIHYDLKCCEQE